MLNSHPHLRIPTVVAVLLMGLLTVVACNSAGRRAAMTAIRSRAIAYIDYDVNNNPQTIYFTNGNETRYTYSATGEKLRVLRYIAYPNVTRAFGMKPEGSTQSEVL